MSALRHLHLHPIPSFDRFEQAKSSFLLCDRGSDINVIICQFAQKSHVSFGSQVNSCLASYRIRATTTNQPTDRATNELTRPDPDWQRTRSGPELRRNGRFYVQQKVFFFCQKWVLTKKDTQKFLKRLIFIWKKATFFLWTTFSGRGQNMVRVKK